MNTTAKRIGVDDLAKCLDLAKQAAIEAGKNEEDGGTCNLDCPAFQIPGMPDSIIQTAATVAGVTCSKFKWFGAKRWYWVTGFLLGQGNRRSRMSDAATKMLKQCLAEYPEIKVCEYCQMD